jgi:hypothetical protein
VAGLKIANFHAATAAPSLLQVAADIHALMQRGNDNKFPLGETIKHKIRADHIFEKAVPNINNPCGLSTSGQTIESIDNGSVVTIRLLNRPISICEEPYFFEISFRPG